MKLLILICLFNLGTAYSATKDISIEKVAEYVSKQNYTVLENAEKVYQRKANINFARKNLLPKLNLWNILKIPGVIVDPLSIGDIIQDVAPFLVPSNWFELKKQKYIFQAEREQYRSLWANEVATAKMLYLSVYRDSLLQDLILEKSKKYKEVLDVAEVWSVFGGGSIFSFNIVKDRYLALSEDIRSIDNLIFSEEKELQYLAGINQNDDIRMKDPELVSLKKAKSLDYDKMVFKVLDASPEIVQYSYLAKAVENIKDSLSFSILGASSFSSGDTFGNIPIQDGLGFGFGPTIQIAQGQEKILEIQKRATTETLKKQTQVMIKEHNSLLENYSKILERIELAKENYENLKSLLALGGEIDVIEMMEILDNIYSAKVMKISYDTRFNLLQEKLKRMTFSGDYSNAPLL